MFAGGITYDSTTGITSYSRVIDIFATCDQTNSTCGEVTPTGSTTGAVVENPCPFTTPYR
jgi:hypothetical protein